MKKLLVLFAIVTVSLFLVTACEQPPPSTTSPSTTTTTTDTSTAVEPKVEKAWPFSLEEEFQGSINAVMTTAELTSRNFVIVFDDSGSMNDSKCSGDTNKIGAAKKAVAEWSKTLPEGANLGMVTFHNGIWELQPFTPAKKVEFTSIMKDVKAGGGTPLGKAAGKAFMMLTGQALRQLGYGEYTIVIITDGEANSPRDLERWVDYILANSPVQIITIGFCIGDTHSLNQPGRVVYKEANNPEELRKGLQDVLAEAESFDVSKFE